MAPIRLAIIGLSANAATSWVASAHLPYLVSPRGRAKYDIVALCNSSVDRARAAIAHFGLPDSVRAYGSPEQLARDPQVDLVVCSTRVDLHYSTLQPALEAGRAVLCEWPLAQDTSHARRLVALAEAGGVRTAVAIQGRFAPVAETLRAVMAAGRIGKILSVEARAFGGLNARDTAPTSLAYSFDRKVGGNMVTIGFGHLFDTLQSIVGEISDLHGHAHLQRPNVYLRAPDSQRVVGTTVSDVPDLMVATGRLAASPTTQEAASVQIRMRLGPPWPGEAPLVVRIAGERAELRLTFEGGMSVANAYHKPVTIDLHDFATDKVEPVAWAWEDWQADLPDPAKNIGALYEAYARGEGYPTFGDALLRHEQLDRLLEGFVGETR